MPAQDEYVVEILRDFGLVNNDEIIHAHDTKKAQDIGVVETLVKAKHVTEADVTKCPASQFGVDAINLADNTLSDDVLAMIPRQIACRYKVNLHFSSATMLFPNRILALNIGASSVKIGELHTGNGQGLCLVNFNHAGIGLDSEREENRKELLVAAVRNMLREKGIRAGKVVFCVPGQSVFTRFVKLPPVEESKVVQIIQYEARQNVPFPIEEVIWDFQLIGTTEAGGLEVMLLAIKSDIIEELSAGAESAGLETGIVDVAPMAPYNIVLPQRIRRHLQLTGSGTSPINGI